MRMDDFVGLPWRERGRDKQRCDCWGLSILVFRALAGIELPSHADDYLTPSDREECAAVVRGERVDWIEVQAGQERRLDLVLMRDWHVGIVERPGLMLHMPRRLTSRIEPYRYGRQGLVTFHRHRALAA